MFDWLFGIGDTVQGFLQGFGRLLLVAIATVALTGLGVVLIVAGVLNVLGVKPGDVVDVAGVAKIAAGV